MERAVHLPALRRYRPRSIGRAKESIRSRVAKYISLAIASRYENQRGIGFTRDMLLAAIYCQLVIIIVRACVRVAPLSVLLSSGDGKNMGCNCLGARPRVVN